MVGDVIPSWSPAKGVTEWPLTKQVLIARPIVSLLLNGQKGLAISPLTSRRKLKKTISN